MIGPTPTGFVCSACGQRYDHHGYCPQDGHPLAPTDDPLLGAEVGRYRVARLLGEGGMGRVYLAVHPAIGSRVAIKILSDQCARDPVLLERFFAEARAVNLVHHESIVSVLDLSQLPDGRPFIVMEYIEGHTLGGIARAGAVPLGGLVQVMSEVLSALAAAHAIGIVHRDLKPDNVLITAEGHAKVLDFGIAKLAPELQQQLSPRTQTGALLGTPQYMAPEQITGSAGVDPRTDIYAAGVVLYELATGRQPFVGETLFDLMRAHLEEPPRPPRALRPDLPAPLEQVILTALAKRPDDRFPSAAAMAEALHQAAAALPPAQWRSLSQRTRDLSVPRSASGASGASGAEVPLAYRPTQPVAASPTVARSRRGLIAAAAVIAALLVGVAVVAVLRRAGGGPPAVATASDSDTVRSGSGSSGSADSAPGSGSGAVASLGSAKMGSANTAFTDTGSAESGSASTPGTNANPANTGAVNSTGANTGAENPGPANTGVAKSDETGEPPPSRTRGSHRRTGKAGAAQPGGGPVVAQAGKPPAGGAAPAGKSPPSGATAQPAAAAGGAAAVPAGASGAGSATIVGGGSAADHGVIIGPNVHLGPGVVIGSATPPPAPGVREELTRPADYDPRHFDPVGYLPRAQKLARELLPDAQLTSFEFDPVFSDGRLDLTVEGRDREYEFRSPERSAFPAGRPRNLPIDRKCRVHVEVGARSITARVLSSDACDDRLVRAPRCSFAAIWKRALAAGTPSDFVARIGWLHDETWFFDTDLAGKGGGVSSYPDRCP